jgi:aminopeptidase N
VRRTDPLTDSPSVGIPLALGFRGTDGAPLAVAIDGGAPASEHVVVVDSREQTIHVDSPAPFVLAPMRGYSAPVDLSVDLDSEHLASLLVHDDDPYTRWWAAETAMIRAIDAHRAGDTAGADAEVALLADALRTVLAAPGRHTDPLMLAQLLAVPDEFMLGDRATQIDVDGVAAGLAFLRARLGAAVHDPLLAVLERQIDEWLAGFRASNPAIEAVDRGELDERRWDVRMRGEQKEYTTVWLTLGQRTLRYETYVMPAPEDHHSEVYDERIARIVSGGDSQPTC